MTVRRISLVSLVSLLPLLVASFAGAADSLPAGQATLKVAPGDFEPVSWPVVVYVTVSNTGTGPIYWWSGGPATYPRAQDFNVEIRFGSDQKYHAVAATNGQYEQGSGADHPLKPGQLITVPLAIPIDGKQNDVWVRVGSNLWPTGAVAECHVRRTDRDQGALDDIRARVIEATIAQDPPFLVHMAETYPDAFVIDAMLKLVAFDNVPIAGGAADVLAHQKTIAASAGQSLGECATLWLNHWPSGARIDYLQQNIAAAALKTESTSARDAVLKAMSQGTNVRTLTIAVNALALSPGDATWLGKAKDAISALSVPDDSELAKQKKWAIDWLAARIKKSN